MNKALPYVLLLPLALIVLFTQCEKEPDHVNIPDDAFLNALIEEGVDTNGDGLISSEEAEAVTSLYVGSNIYVGGEYIRSREKIKSLDGIEAFVNLDSFDCGRNELSILDVSGCAALRILYCGLNQLTNLDVSNNTALLVLDCEWNQLTSLDVSNNTAITSLSCDGNQLTSLDISITHC